MSKTILTDAFISIAGTTLSDHVRRVTVQMASDDVDLTAMGAVSHEHGPGLRDDRINLDMYQDYASSKTDAVLSAAQGVAAGVTIIVKPTSATVSATNPTYTMVGVLMTYHPLDGEVGAASITPVEFVPAPGSYITRATA